MLIEKEAFYTEYERLRATLAASSKILNILCANDVDALTCTRVLTSLLRSDCLAYKIRPVQGYDDVKKALQSLQDADEGQQCVFMINCGAMVDLNLFCGDSDDLAIFVCDSHRPYNLENIRIDNENIRIMDDGEIPYENYPQPEEYEGYESPSGSEDNLYEDSDSDDYSSSKRRRHNNGSYTEVLARNREIKARLDEYYRGTYYGVSSSCLMYDLAVQLGKDDNEILWYSIVGSTDQYVHELISSDKYNIMISYFHDEVQRHNEQTDHSNAENEAPISLDGNITSNNRAEKLEKDELVKSVKTGHITFQQEFRFMLLRHWNLYDAMYHSHYVASRLGVWKELGKRKFQVFLTKMGLPLNECKGPFKFMGDKYKNSLLSLIEEFAPDYGLTDISYPSFQRQHNDKLQNSASDVVYSLTALLEDVKTEDMLAKTEPEQQASQWERNFWNSYDALDNVELVRYGLTQAQDIQRKIVAMGVAIIKKKEFISSGPFRYCLLDQSIKHSKLFGQPLVLSKLALFLVRALHEGKRQPKPFLIAAHVEERKTCLVIGVTGRASMVDLAARKGITVEKGHWKNTFGDAFRYAARKSKATYKHEGFQTSVLECSKEDLPGFLEVLHSGIYQF